ncbi:50S ribosomal protein L19 [Mesoplasma lactucae ATCC 49193]|uniref:Large ribosomal subunit protein bL19 n=1 Tax=Mesoplasma lactucae ATCC 49193 TaxID=81460 RepID=A0A291IRG8_9MOLU|nr:50S ribosomal protein L19 [Mesoplasma lactucae ATCC 49193]ATZ20233.1 50S ribosomal protein L19 [Mesoplasma lactucae ATCC 49193]MCL8216982.1 50S ribosomal protein L19 [Mesoplasma lactucae ATCC 49193]
MSSIKTKTMKSNYDVVNDQLRNDLPDFTSGDTIRVDVRIKEGDKFRIQSFEGLVIKTQGSGISYSVTVRKLSNGVFVERTFPLHSPIIDSVTVVKRGRVRRARIYYIRNLRGKAARIKEVLPTKKAVKPAKEDAKKAPAAKATTEAKPAKESK